MQLALLHWVRHYKQIFEMSATDRPPDSVIENDEELDRWLKAFVRKASQGSTGRGDPKFDMKKVVDPIGMMITPPGA